MSEKDSSGRIKVTDKRRFTAEGELREEEAESAADEPQAERTNREAPEEASQFGPREPARREEGRDQGYAESGAPARKPGFVDLVSVLAEPIPLFLGDLPLPNGESAEDLDRARLHIDLLDVLREKAGSNLSAAERALLDDLLYKLRMRYVQKRG